MYFTYKCKNGHKFEISKGLKESVVLIACPTCGSTSCKRVWSAPPVHFKGEDFYVNNK